MFKQVAKYSTGLLVEADENGYSVTYPDGKVEVFDVSGALFLKENELANVAKKGDYIECIPGEERFVVSKLDSGHYEEQVFDTGKATMWRVYENKDGLVEVISAKSVGKLTLNAKTGYLNSVYVLNKIAQACANPEYAWGACSVGYLPSGVFNLHINNISDVADRYPYTDEVPAEDIEVIKELGLESSVTDGIWLASRNMSTYQGRYYFGVRVLDNKGNLDSACLNKAYIAGDIECESFTYDVFVVMTFNSFAVVESGDGTKENPYKLTL